MKIIRLFIMAAIIPMMASCLSDNGGNSGFSGAGGTSSYANTANGYIQFASIGNWYIVQDGSKDWLKIDLMRGNGYSFYVIPTHFEQNKTGLKRTARITIQDAMSTMLTAHSTSHSMPPEATAHSETHLS